MRLLTFFKSSAHLATLGTRVFFPVVCGRKLSGESAIVTSEKKTSGHGSYEPHFHEYRF